ncbi:E3 ubiquitin-protein ligase RBBP6-like [Aquila chrysaetos chrysaetos]|uniref:E3 ubiquitin-protein ligase RBBP6-like n=1 Tax=Aquila chrysaetos chrysaetos TaxID=223781 RepID=UPI001B7D3183|nr:E3 ubiquitin-protein ligase RBBP6-like [Aquila chrysaetos chrysaetos]XP_040977709.1 E3 ubiquitin-protein ligase RBBP6-like [Aquila chrysaetos chrysaetos]
MSRVHYKFFSKLNYDTVTFDGLYISRRDLKLQIMGHEKLTAASCDLQITNAQTKEGKMIRKCGRRSFNNKPARFL